MVSSIYWKHVESKGSFLKLECGAASCSKLKCKGVRAFSGITTEMPTGVRSALFVFPSVACSCWCAHVKLVLWSFTTCANAHVCLQSPDTKELHHQEDPRGSKELHHREDHQAAFFIFFFCTCLLNLDKDTFMPQHIFCGGQRTTVRSCFSPSAM